MWTTKAQISLPVHATPIQFPGVVFFFFDKSFWKKINDFVTFGTQIFELWVDSEIKVYRDPFKKDIFRFGYM